MVFNHSDSSYTLTRIQSYEIYQKIVTALGESELFPLNDCTFELNAQLAQLRLIHHPQSDDFPSQALPNSPEFRAQLKATLEAGGETPWAPELDPDLARLQWGLQCKPPLR